MIRQAKQEAKYKKLGVRLSPKTVYGILKVIKRKNQPTSFMQNYKRVFCFHKPTAIIQASQNGHYTVLGFIALKTEMNVSSESKRKVRANRESKGEKALNSLFFLDQKLRQIPDDAAEEEQVTSIANITMESTNRFAAEQEKLKQ